jgi:hypothetical protein
MLRPCVPSRMWLAASCSLLVVAVMVLYRDGDLAFMLVVLAAIVTSGWGMMAMAGRLKTPPNPPPARERRCTAKRPMRPEGRDRP